MSNQVEIKQQQQKSYQQRAKSRVPWENLAVRKKACRRENAMGGTQPISMTRNFRRHKMN